MVRGARFRLATAAKAVKEKLGNQRTNNRLIRAMKIIRWKGEREWGWCWFLKKGWQPIFAITRNVGGLHLNVCGFYRRIAKPQL